MLDPVAKIADANVEEWEQAFRTNFFAAVGLVSAALPTLKKRGGEGRVVFVSSGAAVTGYQGWGAYGASKAALNHLCVTLAVEEEGVITVAVRPGVIGLAAVPSRPVLWAGLTDWRGRYTDARGYPRET